MQFRTGCKFWWVAALAAAVDRITKVWAAQLLQHAGAKTVIPGVFSFVYAENRGMAFSMLSGRTILLAVTTLAILIGVTAWLLASPAMPKLQRIALWMVVGGGAGNLYDRLFKGYVIDFIRPDFIRFAIFNLADVFVCAGIGLALLSMLIPDLRKGRLHG